MDPHGTHVTGIMLAQAHNGIGVAGMIPNAQNVCLLVARVFDDAGTGQQDSKVLQGVEWCAAQGARVINLSLGASHSGTVAAQNIYNSITDQGALVISAAGNDGTTLKNYPAAFPRVIGVAALDPNKKRATFSNYNDQVNLAAPGQLILSTVPVVGIKDQVTGVTYETRSLDYAPKSNVPVSGTLVDVGLGETAAQCSRAAGKICVATRGSATFEVKAKCCQNAGGIGIIIANTIAGVFAGTVGTANAVNIPVLSVSMAGGQALRALPAQRRVILSFTEPGYDEISGTSMASPHVAGVAARIWSLRPECTNEQVRRALYSTAEDLGNANFFGHGLVRTRAAYDALLAMPAPCGNGGTTSAAASTGSRNSNTASNANNRNRWSWGPTTWSGRFSGLMGGSGEVEEQHVDSTSKRPSIGSLIGGQGHNRRSLRGESVAVR